MAIKPIPKKALIHNIEYREFIGSDGWNGEYAEPLPIQNVRVVPVTSLSRDANAIQDDSTHVVYVDAKNSSELPTFKTQSKVIWDYQEFEVNVVKPQYGFTLHHYELELK